MDEEIQPADVAGDKSTNVSVDYKKEMHRYRGMYLNETKKMRAEIDQLKSQAQGNPYEGYDEDQLKLIESVAEKKARAIIEAREQSVEQDKFIRKEEQILTNSYPESYEVLDELIELKQQKMYSNRSLKKIYEVYKL
jgi:hypothetical protein